MRLLLAEACKALVDADAAALGREAAQEGLGRTVATIVAAFTADPVVRWVLPDTDLAPDEQHPDEPCWYLRLIGVDPAAQGRGLGSALALVTQVRGGPGVPMHTSIGVAHTCVYI